MLSASCSSAVDRTARAALMLLLAILFLANPLSLTAEEAVLPGKVLRVIDGDTLDVLLASGRIRVRLQGVDAPEHDQPGGAEARQWLQLRVLNREVLLEPVSQDRYERMVALVYLDDAMVNRELVRAGHAWAYRSYLRAADRIFCDIEFSARREQAGLWAAAAPHAPWEFRATRSRGPFTDYSRESADDCWKLRRKK
jgi:micrococcal nuclease